MSRSYAGDVLFKFPSNLSNALIKNNNRIEILIESSLSFANQLANQSIYQYGYKSINVDIVKFYIFCNRCRIHVTISILCIFQILPVARGDSRTKGYKCQIHTAEGKYSETMQLWTPLF